MSISASRLCIIIFDRETVLVRVFIVVKRYHDHATLIKEKLLIKVAYTFRCSLSSLWDMTGDGAENLIF